MTTESNPTSLEPDLFGVIRDRWTLIVGLAFVFAIVGLLVGSSRPVGFESTASVVVEDPRTSALFEASSASRPERYVETQIGIMASPAVAKRASELLGEATPSFDISDADVLAGSEIAGQEGSDLISVTFSSRSSDLTEAAANAIVEAYLELRSSEAVAGFDNALSQLDESIAAVKEELSELDGQISEAQGADLMALQAKSEELASRLVELRTANIGPNDEEAIAAQTNEITAIREQLQAIDTAYRLATIQPELAALLEDQRLGQARLSNLLTRRSEVSVDAELAGVGFVFKTQATPASRTNPSARAFASIFAVIGLMTGVAIAYALAIWRRRVSSPEQPATILRVPFLGAIPDFNVIVRSPLPVANATSSKSAEAFRFVMAAIESQIFRPGTTSNALEERLLLVTSVSAHDGRSTVVANLSLAAARAGRRVLVLDADFTSQRVSELLDPGRTHARGISDVLIGSISLDEAVVRIDLVSDADLSLLSRGSDVMKAEDIFGSLDAADLLESLREKYDLVLVDAPPLSAVGYATTLARLADRVLIIVRHRTLVSRLEELAQRLTLIQSRRIGYVYNRAQGNIDSPRPNRSRAPSPPEREQGSLESALPKNK